MGYTTDEDFKERVRSRLDAPQLIFDDDLTPPEGAVPGDGSGLNLNRLRPASVLMGLVEREGKCHVLLTERPATMKAHPGQVAFPGGKRDRDDLSAAHTALREAHEEVGATPESIELLGQFGPLKTQTGFSIRLFVGLYPAGFVARPCPSEVADVFEAPLSVLMTPDNYEEREGMLSGRVRSYFALSFEGHLIWGVTAALIRNLYDRLYSS